MKKVISILMALSIFLCGCQASQGKQPTEPSNQQATEPIVTEPVATVVTTAPTQPTEAKLPAGPIAYRGVCTSVIIEAEEMYCGDEEQVYIFRSAEAFNKFILEDLKIPEKRANAYVGRAPGISVLADGSKSEEKIGPGDWVDEEFYENNTVVVVMRTHYDASQYSDLKNLERQEDGSYLIQLITYRKENASDRNPDGKLHYTDGAETKVWATLTMICLAGVTDDAPIYVESTELDEDRPEIPPIITND